MNTPPHQYQVISPIPPPLLDNIRLHTDGMNNRTMNVMLFEALQKEEEVPLPRVSVRHSRVLRQNTDGGFLLAHRCTIFLCCLGCEI